MQNHHWMLLAGVLVVGYILGMMFPQIGLKLGIPNR